MEELQYQISLLENRNLRLAKNERMYRLICESSQGAFIYYDYEDGVIKTIANFDYFFDFKINDICDLTKIFECVEDKYIQALKDVFSIDKKGLKNASCDVKIKDSHMWVEIDNNIIYNSNGVPTDRIIRFKDVTKFSVQNEELTYMAFYDVLTDLYNRNYFVRLLGEFIRDSEDTNEIISVMFIDIDDFRKINDGLGIMCGDEVVQLFGQFLKGFLSENVIVSHFNSDIFCIAIKNPCGSRTVDAIYKRIRERLEKPFRLTTGLELNISVSIGVAEYPEASSTTLELINCAEIVMFKAKSIGNGLIKYFDGSILSDFLENVSIESKLKEAVFSKNFAMFFQPQYYTETQKLRGVEALIRWKDDDGNMISPSSFIPIAEKNGAIIPIGAWVIDESIKHFASWRKLYNYPMILSLNISSLQYKQPDFIEKLLSILSKYEVAPEEIELEITEGILIDDFGEIVKKLKILRDIGIKISLDDFGTGYSSLSYLKGLPIDTLKIDKSFIDTVTSDSNTKIIMESIIYMVKKLGLETIAEGVETKEQYEYLKTIDCDNIQGFLLGKPMPSEGIVKLLSEIV